MCMYVSVYMCVNVYVCMCVCTFVGCTYVCVIFNFHDQYFTFSPQSSFTSLVKYIPGLWFPGACCKWFPFLILISDNSLLHSNTSKTTDRGVDFIPGHADAFGCWF